MFVTNEDKADGVIGRALNAFGHAFLDRVIFIGDQLGLCNACRWLQDEARRSETGRELKLLNDYCLDDIGIKRPFDLRNDDLVRRLRAGG